MMDLAACRYHEFLPDSVLTIEKSSLATATLSKIVARLTIRNAAMQQTGLLNITGLLPEAQIFVLISKSGACRSVFLRRCRQDCRWWQQMSGG